MDAMDFPADVTHMGAHYSRTGKLGWRVGDDELVAVAEYADGRGGRCWGDEHGNTFPE